MARAVWNGRVIAASDRFETVEGNVYFPLESVSRAYLIESATKTACPWKGIASYYTPRVEGRENRDAAWYYAEPKPAAAHIRGHVAFWKGVVVEG